MNWEIKYTEHSREDLRAIYEYIAFELLVPDTAGRQVYRIMKAIRALENMPEKYKVYEEEPWKSRDLRYFPVDNYIVFYLLRKETGVVNVVRVIYGGRDIKRQLEETKEI